MPVTIIGTERPVITPTRQLVRNGEREERKKRPTLDDPHHKNTLKIYKATDTAALDLDRSLIMVREKKKMKCPGVHARDKTELVRKVFFLFF